MATKLLYLEDFNVITCSASVVEVRASEDGRTVVVLDQTCFYPRGGGQDWDMGVISYGDSKFDVQEVRLDETGTVWHIGAPAVNWSEGAQVDCKVDAERRNINTRLHSAGHLVDMALQEFEPTWIPSKGSHYPDWCAVEYTVGEITLDPALQDKLQKRIDELLQSDYQNKVMFMPPEEMTKYCRHVPTNMPKNKPSRIVLYSDSFGIPCGGTHVKTLKEIGVVKITGIKVKKGVAKVGYSVEGIN